MGTENSGVRERKSAEHFHSRTQPSFEPADKMQTKVGQDISLTHGTHNCHTHAMHIIYAYMHYYTIRSVTNQNAPAYKCLWTIMISWFKRANQTKGQSECLFSLRYG